MDIIAEGLKQKLIRFENDHKYIMYVHQGKRRSYTPWYWHKLEVPGTSTKSS